VTNQSLDTNYSTRHKRDGWVFGQAIGQNDLRHLYIATEDQTVRGDTRKRAIIAHSMMHSARGSGGFTFASFHLYDCLVMARVHSVQMHAQQMRNLSQVNEKPARMR
jgi:hypothetical protein